MKNIKYIIECMGITLAFISITETFLITLFFLISLLTNPFA